MKINIEKFEDLKYFGEAYREGKIKLNISRLARELNKDRKTIRKALLNNNKVRKQRASYLDNYKDTILALLNDDLKEFEYIAHLYNYMKREYNITCAYSTFRRYVSRNIDIYEKYKNKRDNSFTERFETDKGEQVQFDLKERVKIIDSKGNPYRVNVATLTLGYSRYNIRKIVMDTTYESVISFLAEAFEQIGGTPKEIVIDNIKCLVDKPRTKTSDTILNTKFIEFLKDYNLKCKPCRPYRPKTKGKTETQNKVPSQLKNYNGDYNDLSDVHRILEIINTEDNSNVSQATGLPSTFLFKQEKDNFAPLPSKDVRSKYYLSLNEVMVSNESLISYKSNKYSVPKDYIGYKVNRIIRNNKLHLYYNNKIVALHEITDKKLNIRYEHNLRYDNNLNKSSDISDDIKNKTILIELEDIVYD